MWLDRSASPGFRRAVYTAHDVVTIARSVVARPLERSSWGSLLNLPRFDVVEPGRIYRSGLPRTRAHFERVKSLGVRTLICVRGGGATLELKAFARRSGIRLLEIELGPDLAYDVRLAQRAAVAALDPENQPALVHCDGGRHRAGMVVALARVATGWSLDAALGEYLRLAQPWPFADNVAFIARAVRSAEWAQGPRSGSSRTERRESSERAAAFSPVLRADRIQ